jgi:hypothetical protein
MPDLTAEERFPPSPQHVLGWLMTVNMMGMLDLKSDTSILQGQDERLLGFQELVKQEYSQVDQDDLFDMATGETFLPERMVITHIFQSRWWKYLPLFTSSVNIDDVRNGLMLYTPVAWAFDRGKLCIQVDSVGRMTFHLFDDDLRNVSLASKARSLQVPPRSTDEVNGELDLTFGELDFTFGDLEGKEVQFPAGSTMRPSKWLLALHAYAAWLKTWSLHPNIQFPVPQHIFFDNGANDTSRPALGFSIEQWRLAVHPNLPVSRSRQSLTCNSDMPWKPDMPVQSASRHSQF